MSDFNKNFLNTDTPDVWTREMQRVLQFTNCEQDLRRFKSMGEWEQVLNVLEDLLMLQMETMDEKVTTKEGEDPPVTIKVKGKDTARFKVSYEKIKELRVRERSSNARFADPARNRNTKEERAHIEDEIRELVIDIFQNNIDLGLTYRKQSDPKKAALG